MKKIYFLPLLLLVCLIISTSSFAQQSVLDPNDPIVNYDPNNPPSVPTTAGVMVKWVRSSQVNWNTSPYKAYLYTINNTGTGIPFRLLFPKTYGTDPNKKYPLLLFFHGAGEISQHGYYDNELQLLNCGQTIMNAVSNGSFDGFVLFPQATSSVWPNSFQGLRDIINYMIVNNQVDKSRITISGLSNGGVATWDFSRENPDIVAGVTPISASPTWGTQNAIIDSLYDTPIWLSQGGLDTHPLQTASDDLVRDLRNAGMDIRYTVYPNSGHGVWNNHYAEPDAFSWMMNVNKTNPHVYFGRTEYCTGDPIKDTLGITAGFEAYEWSKDGVIIAGANSNTLVVSDTGTYAARYKSNGQWTYWSPTPAKITYKSFTQTPPIKVAGLMSRVIPAPDGNTSVTLALPPGYASYQWHNSAGQIVGTDSLYKATQVGNYIATVTELTGCPAKPSDSFYVASNNGPKPPDPASGLNGYALSQTAVQLEWSNNTDPINNETAFEIYRGTHTGGPYQLVGFAPADTLSYTDKNLSPNTHYFYIIRAVDSTGAAAVSLETDIITLVDKEAPTAPTNLSVVAANQNSITLQWNASQDNVSIKNYGVYINGVRSYVTTDTIYTIANLVHGQIYTLTVKAFDPTGNISPASNQVVAPAAPLGLSYQYYTYTGSWSSIPDLSALASVKRGIVNNITLAPATSATNYAFSFQGYIHISQSGSYTFYTNSDDGSNLYINNSKLVNNDGLHGAKEVSATYTFDQPGWYPFRLDYYQEGGDAVLTASWNKTGSSGFSKSLIPDSAFSEKVDIGGVPPLYPTSLSAHAISYDSINLHWTDNSANESGFEVYRAIKADGPYQIIYTTKAEITSYVDTLVAPSTTYYYKVQAINQYGSSGFDPQSTSNFATTLNLPSAPNVPTALTATAIASDKITLAWTDASTNESAFEIYRSDDGGDEYRKLAVLPAGTVSYTDSLLYSNTVYSYKIDASNVGGTSNFSNQASATTLNNAPQISSEDKYSIRYGTTTEIILTASDKDKEILTLKAENLPDFASFKDNGDRTGTFTFSPAANQEGDYTNIKLLVSDQHGGIDSTEFTLTVNNIYPPVIQPIEPIQANTFNLLEDTISVTNQNPGEKIVWNINGMPEFIDTTVTPNGYLVLKIHPRGSDSGYYTFQVSASNIYGNRDEKTVNLTVNYVPPKTWYLNFATNNAWQTYPGSPWNNIRSITTTGLKDNFGNGGTVGLSLQTGGSWTTSNNGAQTGNNSGIYPDNVLRDSYYFGIWGAPNVVTGSVTGLESDKKYSLTFFSSSVWTSSANGHTVFQIGSRKDSINVQGNTSNALTFANLSPAADGTISFTMSKGIDAGAGFLNAMIISIDTNTVAPSRPINLQLSNKAMSLGSAVEADWQVESGNANSIEIYRSTSKGGTYTLLNPGATNGSTVSYLDTTVSSGATYYYYLKATNIYGSSPSSDTVSITTSEYIDRRMWYLNFATNNAWQTYPGSPWNNIRSITTTGLKDNFGNGGTVGLSLQTGGSWTTTSNGAQTGNNSGIYPDNVLRDSYYFGIWGAPNVVTGSVTGLEPDKKYSIAFFSSSVWTSSANGHTVFQIGSRKDSINVQGNTSDTLTFANLSPAADGTISFTMSKGIDAGAGFLNAMIISTQTLISPSAPVNLQLNNKVSDGENAIEINWQLGTNNTDSIFIYRSLSKSGNYSLLHIWKTEMGDMTYLDTAVSPLNATTYYYYLVASNSYGRSGSTDTIAITTPDILPKAPANLNLTSRVINYKYAVDIKWQLTTDNTNEVDIYRSAERNGEFTLLTAIPTDGGATSYTDNDVSSGSTFYYYLVAKNGYATSDATDTATITLPSTPPPTPPVIKTIPDTYVPASTIDTMQVSITSSEESVTFSLNHAPSFASLQNTANNMARIILTPDVSNIGDYDSLQVVATDADGNADTAYFDLHITDGNLLSKIYLNFTAPGNTYAHSWNNIIFSSGSNIAYSNLVNGVGKATNITLSTINAWSGAHEYGASTYNNSGFVPDSVMATGYYINDAAARTLKISGLDANKKYNLEFFASSNYGGNTDFTTNYTVNSQTVSLNGIRNTSRSVRINGVIPGPDGSLTISIAKGSSAVQGLINAIIIETYNSDALIAPSGLAATAGEGKVTLNWEDRSDNEQEFRVLRSRSLNGSYAVIGNVNANTTAFEDDGVLSDTRYFYKVVAVSADGATMSSEVASVTTPQLAIYVNFNQKEAAAPSPWNNTQTPPQEGAIYGPLLDNNGNNTGLTLNMGSNFEGENPVGYSTGNNSGLYPDLVMQSCYYMDNGLDTVVMKVSNLNMAMKYDFTFFGSITGYGWQNTTQFIANNQIVALETSYNSDNTVSLSNLSPDANGQILVKIIYTRSSAYAILNAMIIQCHDNYDDEGNKIIDPTLFMRTKKADELGINNKLKLSDDTSLATFRLIGEVYPNPFHQFMNLDLNSPQEGKLNMSLYGINGQLMDRKIEPISKGINRLRYQTHTDLQPGGYILSLRLVGTNQVINIKVIKQ